MDISESDVKVVLENIFRISGFDFRGYSPRSISRRISRFCMLKKIGSVDELISNLKADSQNLDEFVKEITVNVTEMFRDPDFFMAFREKVIPRLATYPVIRIWVAGCSSGEEAYSIAFLLSDAGILNKTIIYATDINVLNLEKAKKGVYKNETFLTFLKKINDKTGRDSFEGLYSLAKDKVIISEDVKDHIVFTRHNLVSDQSFNEFHLIVCRNVLIYFQNELKIRVLKLFSESLINLGFLALGSRENIPMSDSGNLFVSFDDKEKIWQKF